MRPRDEGVEFSVYVTAEELQARQVTGEELTIRFSKVDGRVVEILPAKPGESVKGGLAGLIADARQCGALSIRSAGHLKLTRLMAEYMEHCRRNPNAIILVRLRDGYEALMQ